MLMDLILPSAIVTLLMIVVSNSRNKSDEDAKRMEVRQYFSPYGKYSSFDGTVYRSRAEAKIANFLTKAKIKFIYEFPIQKTRFKTDFYLVDHNTYVEYWGLTDLNNRDGEIYRDTHDRKIQIYNALGLKLVSIYPEDLGRLPQIFQDFLDS